MCARDRPIGLTRSRSDPSIPICEEPDGEDEKHYEQPRRPGNRHHRQSEWTRPARVVAEPGRIGMHIITGKCRRIDRFRRVTRWRVDLSQKKKLSLSALVVPVAFPRPPSAEDWPDKYLAFNKYIREAIIPAWLDCQPNSMRCRGSPFLI